ncbi:MAG TPA: hypothetical protein VEW69_07730 [Alphaproteobacteria bacterium]|nr:hypothetical protein [Alphaproteobacteria bacterium]
MTNIIKPLRTLSLAALCLLSLASTFAIDKEHGTLIREVTMYVSPDPSSQQLARASRGRDTFLMDHTTIDGKPWAHVLVVVEVDTLRGTPREVSGWVDGSAVITTSTPNGDQIIYGEAVDSESQAEVRGGRKNAAQDAMRLYARLAEYFPDSPLAGESAWRAADIRWQLDKSDIFSRPSSKNLSVDARNEIEEELLKNVIKKYPHTKWADLAAYNLLDNKVCIDWKGAPKCPDKEAELFEKYAREHPQSPKAQEALYKAAWRQACLVDIYKSTAERDKSDKARRKAIELAQELAAQPVQGDWKPRAIELIYLLQQNVVVYGNANSGASK